MTTKSKLKKGESEKDLASRRSAPGKVAKMNQERQQTALPATKGVGSEQFARSDLGPAGVARLEGMTPRQRFRDEIDEQTRAINVERARRGLQPLSLFADSSRINGTQEEKLDAFINRLEDKADSGSDPFLYVGSGEIVDDGVSLTTKRMHAVIPKNLSLEDWERAALEVTEWQRTLPDLLTGQAPVAPTPQQPSRPLTAEESRLALLQKVERHSSPVLISQKLRRGEAAGRVIV